MIIYRRTLFILLFSTLNFCSQKNSTPSSQKTPRPGTNAINKRNEWLKDQSRIKPSNSSLDFDVISYAAELDYLSTTPIQLTGFVTISFQALKTISNIQLSSNVLEVQKVESSQGHSLKFRYSRPDQKLSVKLFNPLKPNQIDFVKIHYKTLANDPNGTGLYHYTPNNIEDPNTHSMLFTKTEPQGTSGWMPSQDRPDDRAKFSISLHLPRELQLVSNGLLTKDILNSESRLITWETDIPLPTYLMAFAVSQFQKTSKWHEGLEISIWSREGLAVDEHSLLNETRRQIDLFESLMVPYPFEKYAIVLVPKFRGGMEHASVTFNDEGRSTIGDNFKDRYLMAHELAHHWFGDLVTIKSWDDLWIKEGMATLLAYESMRETEGLNLTESALGEFMWFQKGEAIMDTSLPPSKKYTSGPYDRSAWWLSQLKTSVGVDNFWKIISQILSDYRFSSIDSVSFMNYFKSHLSAEQFLRFQKALIARDVPQLDIHLDESQNKITLQLNDPESALPLPLNIEVNSAVDSVIESLGGLNGKSQMSYSSQKSDSLLKIDPNDQHPHITSFIGDKNPKMEIFNRNLLARQVPSDEVQFQNWVSDTRWGNQFGALSTASRTVINLKENNIWNGTLNHQRLDELFANLTSSSLRTHLLLLACKENLPGNLIETEINTMDLMGMSWVGQHKLSLCLPWAKTFLQDSYEKAFIPHRQDTLTDREVTFLTVFASDKSDQNIELWSTIKNSGSTLRQRIIAIEKLKTYEPSPPTTP